MTSASPSRELQLCIPREHRCFADHFPGAPLVPGALLLQWILNLLADSHCGQVNYLKQVKFLAPVLPGDNLQIRVSCPADERQVSVSVYKNETLVLKGQFECAHE